ncbi:MAG: ester cyclase [Chloroflexi bacterium]|nr:ester cyclase [Chloroflexota bacterium]
MTWTGINIFRIADEKIVKVWFEGNILGIYRQLGFYPPLGEGEG